MSELKVLLGRLGIPESPRWHEGRLWFCNWIDRQVVAVDMDGKAEVMVTRDPASYPMGYSIDWLPDGRLLTTGDKVRRQEPDGSMAVHAGTEPVVGTRAATPTSTARTSTSLPVRHPSRATSSSSRRTGNCARSPMTSSSPMA